MKYTDYYQLYRGKYNKADYYNEYGERYIVIYHEHGPISQELLITGDELNWEVEPLDIENLCLTRDELRGIAKAIVRATR